MEGNNFISRRNRSPSDSVTNLRERRFTMWIFKYLTCLMYSHSFVGITWKGLPYQYCLHCGKVEAQNLVKESVPVEVGDDKSRLKVVSS